LFEQKTGDPSDEARFVAADDGNGGEFLHYFRKVPRSFAN
jgi:hypothetical protein